MKHLMRLRSMEQIPGEALSFYEQREQVNEQRVVLKLMVDRYNELRSELMAIEEPLVQPTLEKMDSILQPAETTIIWSGNGNVLL